MTKKNDLKNFFLAVVRFL